MSLLSGMSAKSEVGRSVGWRIAFPEIQAGLKPLTLSHETHYADISATLPGTLSGGSFRFEIESLNISDFRLLAEARLPKGEEKQRPLVRAVLTLFWRDRVGDSPDETDAPVTAVVGITGLARLAEGIRIKTIIEGRDWIYERLARAKYPGPESPVPQTLGIGTVLERAGLESTDYSLSPLPGEAPGEKLDLDWGTPILNVLERLGDRLSEKTGRRGRSLYLLRDGVLHAGPGRSIPFSPTPGQTGEVRDLPPGEDVKVDNQGERRLTTAELRHESADERIVARDAYLISCIGWPSLKPGDVVKIKVDGAEAAEFGGFGLPSLPSLPGLPGGGGPAERHIYINSVEHRLGKNRGWKTQATGVTVDPSAGPEGIWDIVEVMEPGLGQGAGSDHDSADPSESFANQIRNETHTAAQTRARPRIGEVRANHQATSMSGAAVSIAAQSLDLFVGLKSVDGDPRRARRQDVDRSDSLRSNIPYLTPFAWGPYGQVLPHYPGERVLVEYHEDSADDPVVVGSLWQTKDGSTTATPQNVQAGDWWLILPAGIDPGARASAPGTSAVAPPSGAKAVHDLIDATGARIVQVK
jgi:hypothetical protein